MTIKIHEDGIDRVATEEEVITITETQEEAEAAELSKRAALEVVETKKQEVLAKLGLTQDEVTALLA